MLEAQVLQNIMVHGEKVFKDISWNEAIRVEPYSDRTDVLIRRGRVTSDLSLSAFWAHTEQRAREGPAGRCHLQVKKTGFTPNQLWGRLDLGLLAY